MSKGLKKRRIKMEMLKMEINREIKRKREFQEKRGKVNGRKKGH